MTTDPRPAILAVDEHAFSSLHTTYARYRDFPKLRIAGGTLETAARSRADRLSLELDRAMIGCQREDSPRTFDDVRAFVAERI